MTVKELEAAFTAAAENTMQKAEALGLDSASLRAQCEKHGAAACLKRCIQRGPGDPPFPGAHCRWSDRPAPGSPGSGEPLCRALHR